MKILIAFLTLSFTFSATAKGISSKLTLIKCVQDVVDYGIAGEEGLSFSARTLQDLDYDRNTVANLLKDCIDFKATQIKETPDREKQIAKLTSLRDVLSPNVYFFIRGVIRPLIHCTPAGLVTRCESATGKRWVETVIFDQRKTINHYRLGHSTQGPIVRGMVNLSHEDLMYLESLPSDLGSEARDSLQNNEKARYLRIKVMKKKGTLKYIRHYFENL